MKLGFEDAIILENGEPGKIVNKGTFLKYTFLCYPFGMTVHVPTKFQSRYRTVVTTKM